MVEKFEVLCEVIFSDPKSGVLTSLIGKIDENKIISFLSDSEDFLIFRKRYHPPILKKDIKEIMIYFENKQKNSMQESSRLLKRIKPIPVKIS